MTMRMMMMMMMMMMTMVTMVNVAVDVVEEVVDYQCSHWLSAYSIRPLPKHCHVYCRGMYIRIDLKAFEVDVIVVGCLETQRLLRWNSTLHNRWIVVF
jgi:hypothetical protein